MIKKYLKGRIAKYEHDIERLEEKILREQMRKDKQEILKKELIAIRAKDEECLEILRKVVEIERGKENECMDTIS